MAVSKSSKSSPISKKPRPRGRKPIAIAAGPPWRLALFLAVLSALAIYYFCRDGQVHWYGDASAHLNIARRILDGRHPGYDQIGRVWLPLPHVLMLPFVQFKTLWQTGLAGTIPSGLCFVAAALFLYGAAAHVYGAREAGIAAALLFALNPNMLYLQSLAMTEAIFICALSAALYASVKHRPALAGLALLAATLTRYEGWFFIPFAVLYFALTDRRGALIAGAIASIGPLYWLAHNQVFYGDAFDFYHGIGSAKWIYQQSLDKGLDRYPGDGNWLVAAEYYAMAGRLFTGIPLLVLGALGVIAALARKAWWPLLFLALGPVFYVISMHGSGTPIFVPNLFPFSYYNTRYGMAVLPLAAFAAAALPAILPQSFRKQALALMISLAILPWVLYPKAETWVTWKESDVNSAARRDWTAQAADFMRENYIPGRGIAAHFGDQTAIFRDAGIDIRQTVHDGDGLQFQAIVNRPDLFLWQEWVVAISGDSLSSAMAQNAMKIPRYRRVKMIEVKGAAPIEIWQRSAR